MTNLKIDELIWSVAEILRGDFKKSEYGKIILAFTALRRMDNVAMDSAEAVRAILAENEGEDELTITTKLGRAARIYNATSMNFTSMVGDPDSLASNLIRYVGGFPADVADVFKNYKLTEIIEDLAERGLLFKVTKRFETVDLSPHRVRNEQMGDIFEALLRRFADAVGEEAGEDFTPREIINLMVNLLFIHDDAILSRHGIIKKIYDPTAGTGGMLTAADEYIRAANPRATLNLYGQELNSLSYAICKADMIIKGYNARNIKLGDTLANDQHPDLKVDYVLSNPPFGTDWGKIDKAIRDEHTRLGLKGRFGPGVPRKSDGTLLFMLHGLSKLDEGGRMGIVTNGSPLFTGNAGSGESEIRRYLFEHDLIEGIIGLPTEMFFDTGIQTFVWILTRHKPEARKGKVQLLNAGKLFDKMRKSKGNKRNIMNPPHIDEIVRLYGAYQDTDISKIVPNEEFGYRTITIDRPMKHAYQATPERLALLSEDKKLRKRDDLDAIIEALATQVGDSPIKNRATFLAQLELSLKTFELKATDIKTIADLLSERDESAEPARDSKRRLLPDTDLRDTEDVPLTETVQAYFEREVKAFTPDAWINDEVRDEADGGIGKVGYEIPFNRYFYTYETPPALEEIDARIKDRAGRIMTMLQAVVG